MMKEYALLVLAIQFGLGHSTSSFDRASSTNSGSHTEEPVAAYGAALVALFALVTVALIQCSFCPWNKEAQILRDQQLQELEGFEQVGMDRPAGGW